MLPFWKLLAVEIAQALAGAVAVVAVSVVAAALLIILEPIHEPRQGHWVEF